MNRKLFHHLIGGVAMSCIWTALTLYVYAGEPPSQTQLLSATASVDERELETLVTRVLQDVVDRRGLASGQTAVQISTSLSVHDGRMRIELGPDAITSSAEASEDQCHALTMEAYVLLRDFISVPDIQCTYGGKDINFYHPDPALTSPSGGIARPHGEDPPRIVMISAGHGYFFNRISQNWETRRPVMNGMQEDFTTPLYAWTAAQNVIDRLHFPVVMARSDRMDAHIESGHPWWKMSARTWLQSQFPDNPVIWDSLPNENDPDGEEDDDIRARPLFANHVGATYSLHIHTNGAANESARGTVGIYQNGRPEDAEYAQRMLCSMEEIIQSIPRYSGWRVDTVPRPGNYGELRLTLPDRRAALIEVGFHSNANDAAALQSADFRIAASAGMAKGIRLYSEGKRCEKFKIDDMPDVSSPVNMPFTYSIGYSGNPTFPVTIYAQWVKCPSGWICQDHQIKLDSPQDSPIIRPYICRSKPWQSGVFRWKRWLVDADGVKTEPMEHTLECTATSARRKRAN